MYASSSQVQAEVAVSDPLIGRPGVTPIHINFINHPLSIGNALIEIPEILGMDRNRRKLSKFGNYLISKNAIFELKGDDIVSGRSIDSTSSWDSLLQDDLGYPTSKELKDIALNLIKEGKTIEEDKSDLRIDFIYEDELSPAQLKTIEAHRQSNEDFTKTKTFPEKIMTFRSSLSIIFSQNNKIFDNIFLTQDNKKVEKLIDKFDKKVNHLLGILGIDLDHIRQFVPSQLESIFLNVFIAEGGTDKHISWNKMIQNFWNDNFKAKIDKTSNEDLKNLFLKCFQLSVMSEIFKIAKTSTIADISVVFDKLDMAIDSYSLESNVFNRIYRNSLIEYFALFFTGQNVHVGGKISGFYSLAFSAQRRGALSELDVMLNYLPRVLKNIYFDNTHSIQQEVNINKFDYSKGKDKISSLPFLSKQENTRYPDQGNWEFVYKILESFVKITPIKYVKDSHASKNTLVDAITSLYVQFRNNLNTENIQTFNVLVSLINSRHTEKNFNSFTTLFTEVLNKLAALDFHTLYNNKFSYKGPKGIIAEETIIGIINVEIWANYYTNVNNDLSTLDSATYKAELTKLSNNPGFILKNIVLTNPRLFKIKDVSIVQEFLRDLSQLPISAFTSWNTISAGMLTQVIGVDRVSSFEYYRQNEIKDKILGDYSSLLSAVYTIDKSGALIKKTALTTPLDRAFRFIHNMETYQYALIEVSHNTFISNPDGWADGIIFNGQMFKNALFTDYSGNLLSSLFFNPESDSFTLKTVEQFNKEFLSTNLVQENGQNYGVNILFLFSKSDTNRHMNGLFATEMINPAFAPMSSIYHYKLPTFKNYFENINIKSLLDFKGQLSAVKGKVSKTFRPAMSTIPFTKEQLFQVYLKLFEVKKVFSPKSSRGTTTETVSDTLIYSILGDLNMVYNPETGKIDLESRRTINDIEGILSKLFDTEEELRKFLFLKEKDGELVAVHKDDYKNNYVSTMKQWQYMLYDKIANFPLSKLGNDRVSKLIMEARNILRKLDLDPSSPGIQNPLDISHIEDKNNERDFLTSELKAGKTIHNAISRLFGHVTLRFIFLHMVRTYDGKIKGQDGKSIDGIKLDITTRQSFEEISDYLDQFSIKSPTQDKLLVPLRGFGKKADLHLLTIFFGASYLHLPVESRSLNEANIVKLSYSPLPFLTESLKSSNIESDINSIFINEYKTYLKFLYDNQGFTAKLHLFIQSGKNTMEAIENKLNDYASIPGVTNDLILELIADAKADVFRSHSDVSYGGKAYPSVRIQIESFLKSNAYSKEITFYRTLDTEGKPIKIEFTKDDFRGYFMVILGKVKSYQFKQGDIDALLDSDEFFKF